MPAGSANATETSHGTHRRPACPSSLAIPKEGYFEREDGPYGPVFPKTPANYGFSVLAKVKPGQEDTIRGYAKTIEASVKADPTVLATLKLHYLRWIMFPIGDDLYFMYQGIFDTDFDKYIDDALAIFLSTGITTVFTNLEGFPEDWKEESGGRREVLPQTIRCQASWSTGNTPTSAGTKSRRR